MQNIDQFLKVKLYSMQLAYRNFSLRRHHAFVFKVPTYVYNFLSVLVAFSIISCSRKNVPSKFNQKSVKVLSPINQADPSIFHYNGTYYLYGTNDNKADSGFLVYTSKDLKNWTLYGSALRKGDAYGDWGFWVPQVWADNGKFYMAYTANERISIAESESPKGPFRQTVKQPLSSEFRQIDPYVFIDDDGKKYLYHVRLNEGNHIYVAEINNDYSSLKPGTYKECISATPTTWEHVNNASVTIAEGPTVVKKRGLYYLFYSVNDFRNKNYAVGYAISQYVNGPWTRYAGNPILHTTITGQSGSGHGDLVKGKGHKLYYVFHTHNSATVVGPRKSAIVDIKYVKDANGDYCFVVDKDSFRYLQFNSVNKP